MRFQYGGSPYLGCKTQVMALILYFTVLTCGHTEEHEEFWGKGVWVYILPCGAPSGKSQGLAGTKGVPGTGPRGCSVGPGSDAALGSTGWWHVATHLIDDGASPPSRELATPPVCISGAVDEGLKVYEGIITDPPQILNWASF